MADVRPPPVFISTTIVPIADRSPSASETRRRRRSRSRLMSTGSSVVSAAAAGIPCPDDNHRISNNEAMVHLIKATVGGGFLAMPEAFGNVGWVMGIVGTIVIGLAVLNMMSSIVRISQALRSGKYTDIVLAQQNNGKGDDDNDNMPPNRPYTDDNRLMLPPMDYPDTVAAVFQYGARGRFARWTPFIRNVCSITLIFTYYGVNIIYVCIISATCKQIVDQNTANGADGSWTQFVHGQSIRWYPAVAALLIVPVGMVRLIKYLVPFSMAANTCLVAGVGIVFYYIVGGDDRPSPTDPEDQAQALVWPAVRWSLFAGSTLCSLEGIGMLLHIENAMQQPLELAGPPAYTLHKSMLIIVILNGILGLSGYLRYGAKCQGSISLNLPPNNRVADVIKIIIALGILLTYGLQLTVTADLAWQGLRRRLMKKDGKEEVNDEDNEEFSPRMTAYYYGMRFSLILGTILVATVVPDIGPLVSLVGSVGFSILGLILPVIAETVWYWCPKDDDGGREDRCGGNGGAAVPTRNGVCGAAGTTDAGEKKTSTTTTIGRYRVVRNAVRNVKNVLLFVLGVFALIGGAYYNVRDIVALSGGGGGGGGGDGSID